MAMKMKEIMMKNKGNRKDSKKWKGAEKMMKDEKQEEW